MKWLLLLFFPLNLLGFGDPYLVESKVQTDLEGALAHLIPRDQFLIQVTSEVKMNSERKLSEGETLIESENEESQIKVPPMPGFVPETDILEKTHPLQSRQVYKTFETPVLTAVRAYVQFDDGLPTNTVTRAKNLVQDYLRGSYPNIASVVFGQIPMLKPIKEVAKESAKPPAPVPPVPEKKKPEPSPLTQLWEYARWYGLFLLTFLAIATLRRPSAPQMVPMPYPTLMGGDSPQEKRSQRTAVAGSRRPGLKAALSSRPGEQSPLLLTKRSHLLEKFLGNSEAMKMYYQRLNQEEQNEISVALRGPAFDSLMEGLSLRQPRGLENNIPDLEEKLDHHESRFSEFVNAREWQDRQFFGFLHHLTDEQIITLATHESSQSICVMLRFMKPSQSAFVLDSLPEEKRREVLSNVAAMQSISFSEIAAMERSARAAVENLPEHFYGSEKEDTSFWGTVLGESHQQDSILDILKSTQPKLYPSLKKFRFTLEDAASLPNKILGKILSEVDNEELCLALASCRLDVCEVLLDGLPQKRRLLIQQQLSAYRNADAEGKEGARVNLTRRFREAIAV